MKTKKLKVPLKQIIVGCVGLTIVSAILLFMFTFHKRKRETLSGKNAGDFEKQIQIFMKNEQKDPRAYLKAVYPTSDFSQKSKLELIQIYNSLHMWYNCAAKWGTSTNKFGIGSDDQGRVCWDRLPGCGTTWPEPPFVPVGWIYDWNNYISVGGNTQKRTVNEIVGDQIRWSDGTLAVKDVSASVPSRTYWFWHNGPGPIWMYQRAIFRYIYNPNYGKSLFINIPPWEPVSELKNHQIKGPWAQPALDPTPTTNKPEDGWSKNMPTSMLFQQPSKWWEGVPSNGWLEVTAASEPGLAPSPPICWFDGWRGSGTWINVGRTIVGRNKVDVIFRLAYEAAGTQSGAVWLDSQFNIDPSVSFSSMSQVDIAYQICKNLLQIGSDNGCKISGPILFNARPDAISANWETNPQKIKYNFCISNTYNNQSITGNGSAQKIANNALSTNVLNWEAWCGDNAQSSGWENIPNRCIDNIKMGQVFTADRQAAIMTFDEPLFALAQYLNYDSIQMPHSSNGNGRYQYEYCELRGYPPEVKNRDYSAFMATYGTTPDKIDYRVDFLISYFKKLAELKIFNYRDVLDPDNGPSKPMFFDKLWEDSARINVAYQKDNPDVGVLGSKNVRWEPVNEQNVRQLSNKLGRPVLKTTDVPQISYLWEYNITGRDHISNMFTKLSVLAFIKDGRFEKEVDAPCDIPDSQKVDCIGPTGNDEKTCKSNAMCCYKKSSNIQVPSCFRNKNSVYGQANFCKNGVGQQTAPGVFKRITDASVMPFA